MNLLNMKTYSFMKRYVWALLFFALMIKTHAQQDPQYTQYMYNMSIINPAYATDDLGVVNFGALYRSQWAGTVGAPNTFTFYAHTPFNERVELGVSFLTDEIGDGAVKESSIFGDFAYVLPMSDDAKLSLGLKAGVTLFETGFNDFQLESGDFSTDPAFAGVTRAFPNVGIGAFYFTDRYYVGLSAPNLLSTKHLENDSGIQRLGSEEIHFFLTGGYVYEFNENLKLKPSVLVRAVGNAPLMVDVSANVLFNKRFEAGVSYRLEDALSGMFNFKVTPDLRIGYAYDHTLSNLGNFNSGSHEVFVLFNLDLLGLRQGYDKSPRFF